MFFTAIKARQDHQRIMRAAHILLVRDERPVTPQALAAFVFGRLRIDLPLDDAQRFLDAARVTRGEQITPADTPAA